MASAFTPAALRAKVQLSPAQLRDVAAGDDVRAGIDDLLLARLRETYEGRCSRYGFVKPGSMRLVRRSAGLLMKAHFNGNMAFEVLAAAEACNPALGTVVEARVKAKNNLGLLAESCAEDGTPVLDIIVPRRSAGLASEVDLDALAPRDPVYVEIVGKRFQLKDTRISVIGRAVRELRPADADAPPPDADDPAADDPDAGADDDADDSSESESERSGDGTDDEDAREASRHAMLKALKVSTADAEATDAEPDEEEDEDDDGDGEEEEEEDD